MGKILRAFTMPRGWQDLAWCSECRMSVPILRGQLLQSCIELAAMELCNNRDLSVRSGLLLLWLILLDAAFLTLLCFPHLTCKSDEHFPVSTYCFSELIWESLIHFLEKYISIDFSVSWNDPLLYKLRSLLFHTISHFISFYTLGWRSSSPVDLLH